MKSKVIKDKRSGIKIFATTLEQAKKVQAYLDEYYLKENNESSDVFRVNKSARGR